MHDTIIRLLEVRAQELKASPRKTDQQRIMQMDVAISILENQPIPDVAFNLDYPSGILNQKLASLATEPELNAELILQMKSAIAKIKGAEIAATETSAPPMKLPVPEEKLPTHEYPEQDDEIVHMVPEGVEIISGRKTKEYKHSSSCVMCNQYKDNISSGTGSCYECDHPKAKVGAVRKRRSKK